MEKKKLIFLILITIPLISADCSSIYYFVIKTNYNYTEQDLLNNNISQDDINNYPEECEIKGFQKLPTQPEILTITIDRSYTNCSTETRPLFRDSIDVLNIYVGNLSCNRINSLKYIFEVKDNDTIKGLKVWWIPLVIFLIFVLVAIKKNSWLNKLISKNLKTQNA